MALRPSLSNRTGRLPDADRRSLETDGAETRVSAIPETVKKYKSLGDVVVQAGAGAKAGVPDADINGEFAQADVSTRF